MNVILIAVIVLGSVGLIAALVLFFTAKKFAVKEDPRIGQVNEVLPGANCGGCGFPGCGGMASACVKAADEAGELGSLFCPVGGQPCMDKVAAILGLQAAAAAGEVQIIEVDVFGLGSGFLRALLGRLQKLRRVPVLAGAGVENDGFHVVLLTRNP